MERLEDRIAPASLYVANFTFANVTADNDFSGTLSSGDTVTWNSAGHSPTGGLIYGTAAFSTLNGAIAGAAANDTLRVADGTYAEQVTIDKALTLLGANETINAVTGTRVSESLIDATGATAVTVAATGVVTIKGFSMLGDMGISASGGNLIVQNNIVTADSYGIFAVNLTGAFTAQDNKVTGAANVGIQVTAFDNDAQIIGNQVTSVVAGSQGIYASNLSHTSAADVTVQGNEVQVDNLGLWLESVQGISQIGGTGSGEGNAITVTNGTGLLDLSYGVGGEVSVQNNQIAASGNGILLLDSVADFTATGNTITAGFEAGIKIGTATAGNIQIGGATVADKNTITVNNFGEGIAVTDAAGNVSIEGNDIEAEFYAVRTENIGGNVLIRGNEITSGSEGVYGAHVTGTFTAQGNQLDGTGSFGIDLNDVTGAVLIGGPLLTDKNTVSGLIVGLSVNDSPNVTIQNNELTGTILGIWATGNAAVSITGNSITSAAFGTGITVDGITNATAVTFGSGNTVTDGETGVMLEGALISVATLGNMSFTGQTGPYVTLTDGALAGATLNATAATFDGETGATASAAENFDIEDKIVHRVDNTALGFVRVKAGNVFVTTNSFDAPATTTASVQRGIAAATTGDTVNLESGTYAGNITTAGKAIALSPGASPGQVTINGNLTLDSNDTLVIEADGSDPLTEFDNFIVNGVVTLGGAALSTSGSISSSPGQTLTLIDNDSTDAIAGTFSGLAEGAAVTINGVNFYLSYIGGTGNDVVLLQIETTVIVSGGNLVVTDVTGGVTNDTLTILLDGANVRLTDLNNPLLAGAGATQVDAFTVDVPLTSITGNIQVNTLGGNDALTVDLSAGNFIPAAGLAFNGGAGAGDGLAVIGNGTTDIALITPSASTPGSGTISLNSGAATITVAQVEAAELSSLAAATLHLAGANDVLTIANGTGSVTGSNAVMVSGTSAGVSFLNVAFHDDVLATIDTTTVSGNDTISITGANNGHGLGSLMVNAGLGIDSFNVTGAVSVSGDIAFTTGGPMVVDAALSAGLVAGNIVLTAGGALAVGGALAASNVTVTAGGTADFHVPVSVGAISVTDGHDVNFLGAVTATTGSVTVVSPGGNLSFYGAVSALGSATVTTSGGGDVKFYSTLTATTGSLAVSSTGGADVTFLGAVEATAGSLTVTNPGGNVIYYGGVKTTLSGISHSVQAASLDARSSVTSFDGSIVWEVDELEISGALSGPDELIIQPYTATRAIGLNYDAGVNDLNLTTVELLLIGDGFSAITIGRSSGSGAMTTEGFEFRDPLSLLTPGGTLTINGGIIGDAADASIVIGTRIIKTNVDADVDGAAISTQGASITINGAAITLLDDTLIDSHAIPAVTGGDIFIRATINGAHSFEVDGLDSVDGGEVIFHGLPNPPAGSSIGGSTKLTSFTASGKTLNIVSDTFTTGAQTYHAEEGITTHSGKLISFGGGNITLDGDVHSAEFLRIYTTSGTVEFTGKVDAVVSTAQLEIGVGATGSVIFDSEVTPSLGYVPLANLTVTNAASVTFAGDATVANLLSLKAGTVDFAVGQTVTSKKLSITSTATTFGSDLTLTDGGTITGSALTFGGDITATNTLTIKGGTVEFQGSNTVSGKTLIISGTAVTFEGNLQTTQSCSITANEIDFLGGANSVSGTGATLTLQTPTSTQALRVGGTELTDAAALNISTDDIEALANGFGLININRLAGSAKLTIEAATFSDAVTFRQYASTSVIEVIDLLQAEAGQSDAAFTFIGATKLVSYDDDNSSLTPNVFELQTDGGAINFRSAVKLVDDDPGDTNTTPIDFTITSAGGAVTFSSSVSNTDTALYHNLTIDADAGNVTVVGSITNTLGAKMLGAVSLTTSGVTSLGAVSAETLTVDGGGSAILRGSITVSNAASTPATPEVNIAGAVALWNSVTVTAKNAGPITLGDVDSRAGKAYSVTLASKPTVTGGLTGLITAGAIGQTTPLVKFTASTPANSIALGGDITLSALSLTCSTAIADDADIWTVTGRATLNSATNITIDNANTAIGELSLTGPGASIELPGDVKVVGGIISGNTSLTSTGGKITLSGTFQSGSVTAEASGNIQIAGGKVLGLTDLTSDGGSIFQTGAFQTVKLAADASGDILFDTGTLRVSQLGVFQSGGDITILRGAPNNLTFAADMSITAVGDVVIVADYGTSKANVKQAVGMSESPISAARYLIYAFDQSASNTNNFPGVITYHIDPTPQWFRYSTGVSDPGNPDNIVGTYFVFAQA